MTFALIAAAVAGVIGLQYWLQPERRLARRLARAPRLAIAEFAEGAPARIVGRVTPGETLTAPLSGRACVFYEVTVEDDSGDDRRTIIREARGVPFLVEDGTGRALVDPEGASLAIIKDAKSRSGGFDATTSVEAAFLARHGVRSKGWLWGNRPLRYREGVIEIGETVAVHGFAVREPDPEGASRAAGYRDAAPTRLHFSSSPKRPLSISDRDETKR